ncbi:uncharacterized protein LOC128254214 [Drosophila gunungcola]|uniref:uncharacterized protein LOC128254214 n=1 Tax=Drosophila gunungcola TaxID=103775 RepID=UPI0022E247EC|nr:uncharacterized protein LOC128254214 [Drosophila gunungcola]
MSAENFLVSSSTFGWAMRMTKVLSVKPLLCFLDQFRSNLQRRGIHQLKQFDVAKIAGRKWREMTPAQKSVFIEIARINCSRNRTRTRPRLPVGGVRRCRIKRASKDSKSERNSLILSHFI